MKILAYLEQIKTPWNYLKSIFKWHKLAIMPKGRTESDYSEFCIVKCKFSKSERTNRKEKLLKMAFFIFFFFFLLTCEHSDHVVPGWHAFIPAGERNQDLNPALSIWII